VSGRRRSPAVRRGLAQLAADEDGDKVELIGLEVGDRYYDVSVVPVFSERMDRGFGSVVGLVDVTRNHEIARLKEQFLSSVSHELRTPLTAIIAYTETLLMKEPDKETLNGFLQVIADQRLDAAGKQQ